jgi:hypothetical protein
MYQFYVYSVTGLELIGTFLARKMDILINESELDQKMESGAPLFFYLQIFSSVDSAIQNLSRLESNTCHQNSSETCGLDLIYSTGSPPFQVTGFPVNLHSEKVHPDEKSVFKVQGSWFSSN